MIAMGMKEEMWWAMNKNWRWKFLYERAVRMRVSLWARGKNESLFMSERWEWVSLYERDVSMKVSLWASGENECLSLSERSEWKSLYERAVKTRVSLCARTQNECLFMSEWWNESEDGVSCDYVHAIFVLLSSAISSNFLIMCGLEGRLVHCIANLLSCPIFFVVHVSLVDYSAFCAANYSSNWFLGMSTYFEKMSLQ